MQRYFDMLHGPFVYGTSAVEAVRPPTLTNPLGGASLD